MRGIRESIYRQSDNTMETAPQVVDRREDYPDGHLQDGKSNFCALSFDGAVNCAKCLAEALNTIPEEALVLYQVLDRAGYSGCSKSALAVSICRLLNVRSLTRLIGFTVSVYRLFNNFKGATSDETTTSLLGWLFRARSCLCLSHQKLGYCTQ
jgi:hypothetical protein